jgi:Fe2+ or Zn2+ uptake regulation protein
MVTENKLHLALKNNKMKILKYKKKFTDCMVCKKCNKNIEVSLPHIASPEIQSTIKLNGVRKQEI